MQGGNFSLVEEFYTGSISLQVGNNRKRTQRWILLVDRGHTFGKLFSSELLCRGGRILLERVLSVCWSTGLELGAGARAVASFEGLAVSATAHSHFLSLGKCMKR